MDRNVGIVLHAVQIRHHDMFLGASLSLAVPIDDVWQALQKDWSAATHFFECQNLVIQNSSNGQIDQFHYVSTRGHISGLVHRDQTVVLSCRHADVEERPTQYEKLIARQWHN
jgi:hypothetical protein